MVNPSMKTDWFLLLPDAWELHVSIGIVDMHTYVEHIIEFLHETILGFESTHNPNECFLSLVPLQWLESSAMQLIFNPTEQIFLVLFHSRFS